MIAMKNVVFSILIILSTTAPVSAAVTTTSQTHISISVDNESDAATLVTELNGTKVPTDIKTLRIAGRHLRNEHILAIKKFTSLEVLAIDSQMLTDAMVASIPNLPLRTLAIHGQHVTGETFDHLLLFKDLRTLDVANCELSSLGYSYVGQLVHLRHLMLGNTGITDVKLRSLKNLALLRSLDLFDQHKSSKNTALSADGLVVLDSFVLLENLYLPVHLWTADTLLRMPTLPMLSRLVVYGAKKELFSRLKDFPSLAHLQINNSSISAEEMQCISELPILKSLVLNNVIVSAEASPFLSGCRMLRELSWRSGELSPELIRALANLRLSKMCLDRSNLSDANIELFISSYHNLEVLEICDTQITDRSIELLTSSQTLVRLDIRQCNKITAKGLLALGKSKSLELLIADVDGLEGVLGAIAAANPYLTVIDHIGL